MRIQYYMQYFPGATAAGSMQPMALAAALARRGHEVTVVAADTNLDTDTREAAVDEQLEGGRLRVLRLPTWRGGRGSNVARLKAYLSYMFVAAPRGWLLPRADVVVGSIQPLFAGLAALAVAEAHRAPFVLEVRDLWPDALVVKKAVSPLQARPLHAIANLLYRKARRIVTLTPGIRDELIKKDLKNKQIDVFPNGFDPDLFRAAGDERKAVRARYGWKNDFVAIYTGSFTKVTAMDVVVRAAARLADKPSIRFALFGNGPTKPEIVALAEAIGADNVQFYDPVPKVNIPGLLAAADVGLMSLFETPLAHLYFENKLMDYMGAGKAIMGAMDGHQAAIIRKHDAGRVVSPGDDAGLARMIAQASEDRSMVRDCGARGRMLVQERLLLPEILARYARVIEAAGQRKLDVVPPWEPTP